MSTNPPFADPEENAPVGDRFFSQADPESVKSAGDPIYQRRLDNPTAELDHGRNWLVMYRSDDVRGDPIAVSGIIVLPRQPAPEGGYPLISWAHGTVGVAHLCAPSRDQPERCAHAMNVYPQRLLNHFLDQGWAVAMTDYEGLGVTGRQHPYMLGKSEAYGVLDIVHTARRLFAGQISGRYAIVGHSQGGQAALFAASNAPGRTDGLAGVAAIAPANHPLHLVRAGACGLTADEGYAFTPLFLAGAIGGEPSIRPDQVLSAEAYDHWGEVDEHCRACLSTGFWGKEIKGNQQFQAGYVNTPNEDQEEFNDQLEKMNPDLPIDAPIRITQSADDERVRAKTFRIPPIPFLGLPEINVHGTDKLVEELRITNKSRIHEFRYQRYPPLDDEQNGERVPKPDPDPDNLGIHFATINHDLPRLTGWLADLFSAS